MQETSYLTLADLRSEYPPVDAGIRDLVIAMRSLGYRTVGSCEGHLSNGYHPFPWVSVKDLFQEEDPKHYGLRMKVALFNQTSKVQWELDWRGSIKPTEGANSEEQLKQLQASASHLASFLIK